MGQGETQAAILLPTTIKHLTTGVCVCVCTSMQLWRLQHISTQRQHKVASAYLGCLITNAMMFTFSHFALQPNVTHIKKQHVTSIKYKEEQGEYELCKLSCYLGDLIGIASSVSIKIKSGDLIPRFFHLFYSTHSFPRSCFVTLPSASLCVYIQLYVVSVSVRVSELHLSERTSHPLIPSTEHCFPVS